MGLLLLAAVGIGALWLIGHVLSAAGLGFEKSCPFCRSRIHKKASRCPKCQKDLVA